MSETTDPNDVHVDIYDRGAAGYEFKGKSADGTYTIEGTHVDDWDGMMANIQQSIAKHNAQTGTWLKFATYTYHS